MLFNFENAFSFYVKAFRTASKKGNKNILELSSKRILSFLRKKKAEELDLSPKNIEVFYSILDKAEEGKQNKEVYFSIIMKQKKQAMTQEKQQSRRDFIKKSAYAAPAVISLTAMPAFAAPGSGIPVKEPDWNDT